MNENMELPKILQEFCKNKPSAIHDSLYLFEVVDMDGNIVEEKVGMNILTEFGIRSIFTQDNKYVDGSNNSFYAFCLGNGCSDPSTTIDPLQNSLVSYISELGIHAPNSSWSDSGDTYNASFPITYDPVTKNIYQRVRAAQYLWDYTAGNNLEYEINEFGCCPAGSSSYTSLRTHGLVYDSSGTRSSITKRPNTRLYITPIHCFAINAEAINRAYDNGLYMLMVPACLYQPRSANPTIFPATTGAVLDSSYPAHNNYRYNLNPTFTVNSDKDIITSDPLGSSSNSKSFFFENNGYYATGFVCCYANVDAAGGAGTVVGRNDRQTYEYLALSYNDLPNDGYDTIKSLEDDIYIFTNNLETLLPYNNNGVVNINDKNAIRLNKNFGGPRNSYRSTPEGEFPCEQFDITSLTLYNHDTHDYDINVPHVNAPTTRYMLTHFRIGQFMRYKKDGVTASAYVFVNALPQYKITAFNNTSTLKIVATDAYWDSSTFDAGMINNIATVPVGLQQKRYYLIYQGNFEILNPVYDETEFVYHRLDPVIKPFELTDNGCPLNVSRYWKPLHTSSTWRISLRTACRPIFSQTYGFFLTQEDLVYYDISNKSLIASYKLYMADDTQLDPVRRWITEDEDRIISFHQYECYDPAYPSSTYKTFSYHISKSVLRIWTVGDDSTTPTYEDLELLYTGNDNVDDTPDYSFTDQGFLTVQQVGFNECAVVDIYGVTNNDDATFYVLEDVKHCRCINRTTYCVYQNMTNTHDTTYAFDIYDMSTKTVVENFVIDNGTSYTVNGIVGFKNWVYVQLTYSNTRYTYLYDLSKHSIEVLSTAIPSAYDTGNIDPENQVSIVSTDEIIIFAGSGSYTKMILASDPTNIYDLIYKYRGEYKAGDWLDTLGWKTYFPTISTTHGGHHLIYTAINDHGGISSYNLGKVIDTGEQVQFPPENHAIYVSQQASSQSADNPPMIGGTYAILNDGIVCMDAHNTDARRDKIYYVPIEMVTNMKMTGTTKHINAYNNPVRFWGKTHQFKITNDFSKLINQP